MSGWLSNMVFPLAVFAVLATRAVGAESAAAKPGGTLSAEFDRKAAAVGEVVTLALNFQLPAGGSLPDPPAVGGLENLTVLGREVGPGRVGLRLLVDRLETLTTGAMSLTWLDKDRNPHTLTAEPVALKVVSTLGEKPAEAQLRPLQDIVPVRPPWLRWAPWALAAAALILAAAGLYGWYRNRRGRLQAPSDAVPPHLWATREIQKLDGRKLFEKGKVKEFYFGLSEILRRYLEAIRGFPAAEYTVEEIGRHVQADVDRKLLVLLRQADLVKFADDVPTPARKEDEVREALAYIRETAPPPEPQTAGATTPRALR